MAAGIYKPGQGYWVRVMTATIIGVLTLAGAAWMYGQVGNLVDSLPDTRWTMNFETVTDEPELDGAVRLHAGTSRESDVIGQARIMRIDPDNKLSLVVYDFEPEEGVEDELIDPSATRSIVGLWEETNFRATLLPRGAVTGAKAVEPQYAQGAAAALVILLGAVLAYWVAGVKQNTCEFFIATDMEMKKVNWSTRKNVISSTWVVIGASFIIAAFLFGVDLGFQRVFSWIGVLQS